MRVCVRRGAPANLKSNPEEVVALAFLESASGRLLLTVAHASGDINVYDADTRAWLVNFRAKPNICTLVAAQRCVWGGGCV